MIDKLKGCLKSLTIWFNGICLGIFPLIGYISDALPTLQQYVTIDTFKLIGIIVLIINVGLRFKTTKPLSEK